MYFVWQYGHPGKATPAKIEDPTGVDGKRLPGILMAVLLTKQQENLSLDALVKLFPNPSKPE